MSWLWDDIKEGAKKIEDLGKWGVKQGENVVYKTENTFSGIVSTPLLILAGGVAAFLFFTGKNSNVEQIGNAAAKIGPIAAL